MLQISSGVHLATAFPVGPEGEGWRDCVVRLFLYLAEASLGILFCVAHLVLLSELVSPADFVLVFCVCVALLATVTKSVWATHALRGLIKEGVQVGQPTPVERIAARAMSFSSLLAMCYLLGMFVACATSIRTADDPHSEWVPRFRLAATCMMFVCNALMYLDCFLGSWVARDGRHLQPGSTSTSSREVALASLVVMTYDELSSDPAPPQTCAICLSEFAPNDSVAPLQCGHIFHETCTRQWFCRDARCPLRCAPASPVLGKPSHVDGLQVLPANHRELDPDGVVPSDPPADSPVVPSVAPSEIGMGTLSL